ncbi:MFS transporter [Chloroflexus aggregans]|uniref:Major facilitator superfamily MFS_1 n=1 Tax=Chloroflexus aggregans (strain MD-66 / DSM 9485) TaxID=326427 RepID=B8G5B0_CHLAD|nr:MFS transporter [Chloroflexus aggregans]ACL25616.1 major facilitator superfamily MFS_1 [Chloroflexus aggregans DSM 9485]
MTIATAAATRRWLIPLYIAGVIVFSDMYLTQPILPQLSAEYGIAPATAGLSVSVVVLMIALGSLAVGPLSDRWGRWPVMVGSVLVLSLPTLLCALAPSFGMLLVGRALQGLCIPGLTAVAVAYLGDRLPTAELGRAVGSWIAANVAGGLSGRVVGGLISDSWGWRASFIVFAGLTLAAGFGLWLRLPRDRPVAGGGWGQAYWAMVMHLADRHLRSAYLIAGSLFFGFLGIFTYLPYYLSAPPFTLPSAIVALAYVSYLAGVIVSPWAGVLSARYARSRLITIGLLIAMGGIGLTLFPHLPLIALGLWTLCSGMFIAQGVAPALVNQLAQHAKGAASALYLVAYYLGGTLGGVIPGLGWQIAGWPGVTIICLSALALALVATHRLAMFELHRHHRSAA